MGRSTRCNNRFPPKEKKKFLRPRIIASLLALLALTIIIVTTVSLVLVLKKKTTQMPPAIFRWNATGITVAGVTAVPGATDNLLHSPFGVTLDYSNTLYIADSSNARVQKYARDALNGSTVAGNGTPGASSNQLNTPTCVRLNINGDIFVADSRNHRIQLWSNGAISGVTVAGNSSGINGSTNNLLSNPFSFGRNFETGTLYIADYFNHRIVSYASGASSGVVEAAGNGPGLNNTQLYFPVSICLDSSSNSLLIVSYVLNNIVRWMLGDNHWTLFAGDGNGLAGNTSTRFFGPRDLTLDPMGNVYVVDRDNHRVQFIPADQSETVTIAGVTGVLGNLTTLLYTPRGIALDNQLNIYVADTANHRIQKFQRH